ncbi:MAG: flagella basal body P-ring formation protein FlgA [Pseudomonadota bacterium]
MTLARSFGAAAVIVGLFATMALAEDSCPSQIFDNAIRGDWLATVEQLPAACSREAIVTGMLPTLLPTGDDIVRLERRESVEASSAVSEPGSRYRLLSHQFLSDADLLRLTWETQHPAGSSQITEWFDIKREGWYWKTTRAVNAGVSVTAADVERAFGPVAAGERMGAAQWPARRHRATRRLSAGDIITAGAVQAVPDFMVGDTVKYRVKHGAVQVLLDATLQEDSAINTTARVKLAHNGDIAYGTMHATGTVESCSLGRVSQSEHC